jgi:hypothetical protein
MVLVVRQWPTDLLMQHKMDFGPDATKTCHRNYTAIARQQGFIAQF